MRACFSIISGKRRAIAIPTVIFKLRVINPRSRDAPKRNRAHMQYIGQRPGTVRNEGMKHGLFGVIDGNKAEETRNVQDIARYIEAKTQAGTIAYRAVISFAEADALRLGYDDPEKFRELLRARLPDICDKIGIPMSHLEYTAAIHRDKGHPHCHILFWDKAQDVKKEAFVEPETANAIRTGIIKQAFGEEIAALQEIKNEARKAAVDSTGGFFGGFADAFAAITPEEYAEAAERLKRENSDLADNRLLYSRLPSAAMRELAADLLRLAEHVPKTGRLQFKLMPPEVKAEIRNLVEKALAANADCDREFKKYIRAAVGLYAYYTDKPEAHDKAGQAAYEDIMARLGNAVLREVKKLNQQARDKSWEAKQAAYRREDGKRREEFRRQTAESLITTLFGILSRATSAEQGKLHYAYRTGELSRQARKELALRLEHAGGYDWDLDR